MVPVVAGALAKVGGSFFHSDTTGSVEATLAQWANEAMQGSQAAVDNLWVKAGRRPERSIPITGATIAPQQASKDFADNLLVQLQNRGVIDSQGNITGLAVTPGSSTGVVNPTKATSTGLTKAIGDFFQSVTGQQTQAAGTAAGVAAANRLQGTVVTVGILVAVAVIVGALVLRRR
jgi:hypothetical protein